MTFASALPLALCLSLLPVVAGACHSKEQPAVSQSRVPEPSGDIEAAIGLWAFTPADGSKGCVLALNRQPLPHGYGLHIEHCALASLAAATHWRPTAQGFGIANEADSVILEFRQTGVDTFVAVDGSLRVERAPST
ncbi:AprI/Inh family metalloprotease inhibitor [Brevundimonas subvibrioides]|uniref:AprI/Inh family metalloprotease inhibitor n=1 Tax=Brevundimonas subvibrioides TaxID=74313 RepID=UPI0022B4AF5A|nr:AprI/Inh family metalloprotease inhibitor [Brevundimonas subvibrioides]